jgi:transcriptional regulator GlxA family with amidase domain
MSDIFPSVSSSQNLGFAQHVVPATRRVGVAFILLEQFSLTSFSAALDAFSTGASLEKSVDYQLSIWSLCGGAISSDVGVAMDSQRLALGRLQHQMIVVVGGHRVRLAPDTALSKILRRAAASRPVVCGLWNAAFHLAQAGLLDGRASVCHPDSRVPIKEYHPTLDLGSSGYVLSGRIGSCAEPSAVLDLMLAAMKLYSQDRALVGEDSIKRLHQPERCMPLKRVEPASGVARLPKPLSVAVSLMEENIEEPLDIDAIANHVGVSRRQLERRFARYLNASPVRYYLDLRLAKARQLIAHSDRSLTDVALATGFVSYPHFHRRFKGLFGLPPMEFRDTYDLHPYNRTAFQTVAMN